MKYLSAALLVLSTAVGTQSDSVDYAIESKQLLQDLRILSSDSMEGRKAGSGGGAKARALIIERFKQSGLKPFKGTYEQVFTFAYKKDKQQVQHQGANVVGFIEGTRSGKMLVVTAHHDHLGILKGEIYNGANDNASGVVALFAIASHFSRNPPQHSMIIAALDAEEESGAGAVKLITELDRRQVAINVNLDMLGRDPSRILYAAGTYHYPFLKRYIETIASKSPAKLVMGHDRPNVKNVDDWTKESDHYAFHVRGIPFLYFGVEDEEHHHRSTDDFENMNHDFYLDSVKTVLIALNELDKNL